VLAARRLDRVQEVALACRALNPNITVHPCALDVQDGEAVARMVSELSSPFDKGGIEVLVNNAGLVLGMDPVATVTPADFHTMWQTNVMGLMHCIQAVLPGMKARATCAHIINISSISGREVYPGGGAYCATKHAVDALTRTLRAELVGTPINVSSIDPGMVETEFSTVRFRGDVEAAARVYTGIQPLTAEDVAEVGFCFVAVLAISCIHLLNQAAQTVVFTASRPPHVQIANMLVLPTNQASVTQVHRAP
jgi:3-hydroxy acid dehydrogenase / malonic semialdehyde reductase